MINKQILRLLIKEEVVSDTDYELYLYGLELLSLRLSHFFCIIIIGLISDRALESFVFFVIYSFLRTYSKGFHATTKSKCLAITTLISLGLLVLLNININDMLFSVLIFFFIIETITLVLLSKNTYHLNKLIFFLVILALLTFLLPNEFQIMRIIIMYSVKLTCVLAILGNPNYD